MCDATVEVDPWQLYDVPDHLKTQELCIKAIELDPFSLQYVPKWWVSQLHIELWNSDDYYCNDDEVTEWYKGYKKQKAQKASIKKELLPIAWHPSSYWDWCVPEDEKRDRNIVGINMKLFCVLRLDTKIFYVHKFEPHPRSKYKND